MPSLVEDCGTKSIKEIQLNILYDDLYNIHMDNDNFIYWVKSGENGIISGDHFDELESDENWLYAFAEICYGGDITSHQVIRLFITDTENFEYDEDNSDSDEDKDKDKVEDKEDDNSVSIRSSLSNTCNSADLNALYNDILYLSKRDGSFINWVKSGNNSIITNDYLDEYASDEDWLHNLASICYSKYVSYDDLVCMFEKEVVELYPPQNERVVYCSKDEDIVNEDEWDLNINTNEFIQPKKGGMWLRSMR
jgi:hypothetical protein